MLGVQELYVQCLVAFDTFHSKTAVVGVVVPGLIGNFSLENFQFGFWLESFGAQVF
jgi:hypothetical protein